MKYRKFGRLDWQVSALGLGLTVKDNTAESGNMLRYAFDQGVNFLDVGSPLVFKDNRNLSALLGQALGNNYRQKVKIAVAMPSFSINAAADFDRQLEDLLKWLNLDNVDFLTLGGLNRFSWPKLAELKITRQAEAAITAKKINHIGFLFHDQYQFLREIVESYDNWTHCQFQYSFMDVDHHPGASGLTYAADNGLAVVIVNPLMKGRLTKKPPETVAKIWAAAEPKRSAAEWGLRWVWNHPEVAAVIGDMDNMPQVQEYISLADKAATDSFTVPEELVISRVRDAYRARKPLPCTACRGCMPCPQGIDAPRIFEIYNDAVMYDDAAAAREMYHRELHNIDTCNECGVCAAKCGLKFPIPEWLKKAQELLVK